MRIVSTLIAMAGVVGAPAMAQAGNPLEDSSGNARVQMERFASDVSSEAEKSAIKELQFVTGLRSENQPELRTTVEGMRAILATDALRVASAAVAEKS